MIPIERGIRTTMSGTGIIPKNRKLPLKIELNI
jgi:hypothetical protein